MGMGLYSICCLYKLFEIAILNYLIKAVKSVTTQLLIFLLVQQANADDAAM